MKTTQPLLIVIGLLVSALTPSAFAQLVVPSDGSDGVLNVGTNTVIDLSLATTGNWYSNNLANAGNGVYDPIKWAVVYKYASVNIQGAVDANRNLVGNTVTFLNHPTHAPIVWLVQSNVTINGIVSLNGQSGDISVPQEYTPTEPGPGGFRGGATAPEGDGAGYGIGGGSLGNNGSYAGSYGNPAIVPLIGGSGAGSGNFWNPAAPGAGGGGAILIVAGGAITVNGRVTADGAGPSVFQGSSSSAGAIRFVASQILGNGTVEASVPNPGITRMEANTMSPSLTIFPNAVAVPPGNIPTIWPATNAPIVTIISVDNQPAPLDPTATVVSSSDVGIQNTNAVNIMLQTQFLPIEGRVSVRVTPKYSNAYGIPASYVSGDVNQALWQATTTLPQGFCVLQARATAP